MSSQVIRKIFDRYRFFLIIIPALLFQFVGSVFYFVIVKNPTIAKIIYTTLKILMIIWPIIFLIWFKKISFIKTTPPNRIRSLVYGLLMGFIILTVTYFLSGLIVENFSFTTPLFRAKAEGLGILRHYILFAFILSTLNALFEEYYWRWFVMRSLAIKLSPVASILISALAFSAHHVVILSQFFPFLWTVILGSLVFAGGVLFGLIYQKTNSLIGSFVCHFATDVTILYIGYCLLFLQ